MPADHPLKKSGQTRLEWISLVYLLFFVLAIMSPSIVAHSYFGLNERRVEETLIFIFGIAGLMTFLVYNRIVESRLRERDTAIDDAERAKKELIDSYRYIGQVNRQIEMLKSLSNQTSMTLVDAELYRKDLLQSIVSNAAAVIGSRHAVLRFIDLTRLRTESETYFSIAEDHAIRISNKDLRSMHEIGVSYKHIKTEDGETVLVVSSDRKVSSVRAFLVLGAGKDQTSDMELSLLKVFANQGELVYFNLRRHREEGKTTPLKMVDAVIDSETGEVS